MNAFTEERIQTLFNSFLIRSKHLGYKLMTHYSTINAEDELTTESADYAFPLVSEHLSSIHNFLSDSLELNKFNGLSYNSKLMQQRNCMSAILSYIKTHQGISKGEFRIAIQQNRSRFIMGELSVLKLTHKLITDGKIRTEIIKDGKKLMYVN